MPLAFINVYVSFHPHFKTFDGLKANVRFQDIVDTSFLLCALRDVAEWLIAGAPLIGSTLGLIQLGFTRVRIPSSL